MRPCSFILGLAAGLALLPAAEAAAPPVAPALIAALPRCPARPRRRAGQFAQLQGHPETGPKADRRERQVEADDPPLSAPVVGPPEHAPQGDESALLLELGERDVLVDRHAAA